MGREQRVIGAVPRLRSIPPPPPDSQLEEPPRSHVRQLERVTQAFDALPQELKLVVGLRYQEDCSFAEIAAILGRTEEQVRQLYEQARSQLRPSAA